MQRFILLTCLTVLVVTSPAFAQQMEDVVHLKNGGLIRGTIIEEIPGESLKIQTRDGNIFVYTMDEIAKMSREPVMRMRGHIGVQKKNPWLAFGLSALITGGGQFYNGQHSKGVAQLGGVILGIGLMVSGIEDDYENIYGNLVDPDDDDEKVAFGLLLWFGSSLWSMIDAPISANSINQQNQQPSYGHLIEIGGSRTTLGVDPVVSHKNLGTRLTLHF
ncbi:MAG: hypothetical protein F4Y91_16300 [Gemmatimonadetes bacterium]|nr:hypothetical protein [Gemmatimonadota bacterium]MYA21878.1 hypothetical protein [Gemmatimonadota bacterium]MYB68531.1 hypothetical protein [Gemmatimonadota bacterium]